MIELGPDTIRAIAAEVVRQMKAAESVSLDIQYLASLPPEERKRRCKAEFVRKTKNAGKSA
jgi:hypothetical protein